jgi:hypothetical protein
MNWQHIPPLFPVNLLNASLGKFGYILLTPEDCKGQNGYNEIGMVITGVARRSVERNVNANSTKAGEGFTLTSQSISLYRTNP